MPSSELPVIPAMTTDAEREAYYRLAKQCAGKGAIIELGAWLGASTAYIAAGIRDSGVETRAKVFDRFPSEPKHAEKVKEFYDARGLEEIPHGDCFEGFKRNLGDLIEFVDVTRGEISEILWGDEPISLLVSDAPKRVPAISAVLTRLRDGLVPGAFMAWQDFCHFPSYEIAACLYRLRGKIDFVESIVPGTTLIFRISRKMEAKDVSVEALSLKAWSAGEVLEAWDYWLQFVHPEKKALFQCGAAMFLCDIGAKSEAIIHLSIVLEKSADEVLPKWKYLNRVRPDLVARYQPLFKLLKSEVA